MRIKALTWLCLVWAATLVSQSASQPSPPAPCGTLDLTSPLTQHCFPEDGSHHFVCCVDIQMPEVILHLPGIAYHWRTPHMEPLLPLQNPHSPHGNYNPLARVITQASNASSYSWCTCSEEVHAACSSGVALRCAGSRVPKPESPGAVQSALRLAGPTRPRTVPDGPARAPPLP